MNTKKFEPLKCQIIFKNNGDIEHIHNRQHFDDLHIKIETFNNSQLLRANQKIVINNNKYKITEVYFKLDETMIELRDSHNSEKEQAMSYNSQVVVLLEPLF